MPGANLALASVVLAQPPADPPPEPPALVPLEVGWRFNLTPYLWLPAMDGDLTVAGQQESVSQDLGDAADEGNLAGALHFEAERGRAGFLVDLLYLDAKSGSDGLTGPVTDMRTKQFIGEFGGFFVLHDSSGGDGGPGWRLDALGGLRYTQLAVQIDPSLSGPVSRSRDIFDPFVGARLSKDFTGWLRGDIRADVGGFGIDSGTTSELAWNLSAGLGFRFSRGVSLDVGYRLLSYEYEDGEGADLFEYDMLLDGPYLALQVKF